MPSHLPPEEVLADYASGATSPGVALLVASHLTHAPESRARVREFEEVGGVLLTEEEDAQMSPDALDKALAALDSLAEGIGDQGFAHQSDGPLPQPLLNRLGKSVDDLPWRFQLPGVSAHELDGFVGEKVMLLRAKPGAKVPQHTHEGAEMTLVLQGALSDGGVVYQKGDVAMNDEHDDHRPEVVGDEICYCLIVQQGDLRFTGTFSRFLNYLGE